LFVTASTIIIGKQLILSIMTTERWTDERLDKLAETAEKSLKAIDKLTADIDALRAESKEQGMKFSDYQQATQQVVNLAFGLLATATIAILNELKTRYVLLQLRKIKFLMSSKELEQPLDGWEGFAQMPEFPQKVFCL
jgi:hypothetical protein